MQISHYNSLLYIFIGIIAVAGVYLSRSSGDRRSSFFNSGNSSLWIVTALSIFAGSLFQFWILLLPVLSLSLSAILIIISLIISILLPIMLVKNRVDIIKRFMESLSGKLKSALFFVVIIFFAVIQPMALLYLGEMIIARFLDGSYHFLFVFLISAAGLSTLIGGKKVVVYANAMFGISVIATMLVVMALGGSFSAPLQFLQPVLSEGTQYFQSHHVSETNWVVGFIGFSVITWWMWWIDNGAFHVQGKLNEQRNANAAMFASFPLIVSALVVLPMQTLGGSLPVNASAAAAGVAENELLVFFFVLGLVSVMFSSFSHSFHTTAKIIATQFFYDQSEQNIEEKQILIARLVTVLSALLTILYIPFAQYFGAVTLVVYVQYLACFAASMVGAFTVFVLWKNFYKSGITAGILGGMSAGMIIVLLTYTGTEVLSPLLMTPYGSATGIFFFSMLCSVGGSLVVMKKTGKSSIAV